MGDTQHKQDLLRLIDAGIVTERDDGFYLINHHKVVAVLDDLATMTKRTEQAESALSEADDTIRHLREDVASRQDSFEQAAAERDEWMEACGGDKRHMTSEENDAALRAVQEKMERLRKAEDALVRVRGVLADVLGFEGCVLPDELRERAEAEAKEGEGT